MQKIKNVVVFTGGHAGSTAYATIENLLQRSQVEVHFIGGKTSVEGKKSRTLAQIGLSDLGVKVHNITTGRLQMKLTLWTIPSILKIPLGFLSALILLQKLKPKLVVSFGGYAAFPVVVASWLLKIPVIIHEQTSVAGRANRICSFFAKKIALARSSSLKYFQKSKCVVVGNPIPSNVVAATKIKKINNPPHLLVTGGLAGQ